MFMAIFKKIMFKMHLSRKRIFVEINVFIQFKHRKVSTHKYVSRK